MTFESEHHYFQNMMYNLKKIRSYNECFDYYILKGEMFKIIMGFTVFIKNNSYSDILSVTSAKILEIISGNYRFIIDKINQESIFYV